MKPKQLKTKLTLHRETVRHLDSHELAAAGGGGLTQAPSCVFSQCPQQTCRCTTTI